jgi:hypothetical protein
MMLRQEVRSELERRLVQSAFAGYEQLAEWLQQQGYEIAEASVQRYGSNLQRELHANRCAAQQAKDIIEAAPDGGADAIVDATIQLIHRRIFDELVEAEQVEQADLARVAHTVAELSRTAIARQRWAQEVMDAEDAENEATILKSLSNEEHRKELLLAYAGASAAAAGGPNSLRLDSSASRSESSQPPKPALNRKQ